MGVGGWETGGEGGSDGGREARGWGALNEAVSNDEIRRFVRAGERFSSAKVAERRRCINSRQRTAPDLNAWRLKSPLALRSNSGKTFFSSPCYTSSMSLSHADPPRLARFLSRLRPHPSPLLHCLRLSLSLRLSPTRLSAGREYSCQLIDPAEIDSWAGGSRERGGDRRRE
ncbi:hypothetical protein Q8A73_007769 [Channa argus]|nr:hypothetical protein Q8A73_007769 [Channa argus]